MRPKLRIYRGDDEIVDVAPSPQVTIPLGELAGILSDACWRDRSWVADFMADDVTISEDLYEILTEYTRLRPGA